MEIRAFSKSLGETVIPGEGKNLTYDGETLPLNRGDDEKAIYGNSARNIAVFSFS